MKKIVLITGLVLLMMGCASVKENPNEINQQLDSKSGKEIVLVKVVNDSRCPENVQCVWAGEVTVEVAAYDNKTLVEQRQFTFNKDTIDEIKNWFSEHLPKQNETLKNVSVVPYPKDAVVIQPKDYKIVLKY
ncbi:MAG TPA: hypothetical protein VLB74_10350 [Flavobacterium sp.]|uniref:hypothetical protein n=1 Tax=Flavobacterium sp. TaxID=239 RepID=UPI002C6D2EE5|nr:hypothetical protein [Flavobacterium sp.]HSD15037.1 hypothetical protein [Flavobacterium sp.]